MFLDKYWISTPVIFVVFLNITLNYMSTAVEITCRGSRNEPVDWYIAYKVPRSTNNNNNNNIVDNGTLMVYMDDKDPNWKLLNSSVSRDKNPMAYTLNTIYKHDLDEDSVMYAMYNDQIPPENQHTGKPKLSPGHTKGVINFDRESGYWLIHTVPSFPSGRRNGRYDYPCTGFKFAQMFFCISLNYTFLDMLGELFLYNSPQFYDKLLPQKFKDENPNLTAALEGKSLKNKDLLVRNLTSLKGQKFIGFAKSKSYDRDLWMGIADYLQNSIVVESWVNNGRVMPSECKREYTVENAREIKLPGHMFNRTQDHAKWAVSKKSNSRMMNNKDVITFKQNKSPSWSCVGDINRQFAQTARGGGAVCFEHPTVASNFQNILKETDSCQKSSKFI